MQFRRRLRGYLQTYSTQLAIGLSLLIIATTLSAGVPAYWLTDLQLNEQVASHLRDAQQATLALLQTEQHRLSNIALLFAERPSLATLLSAPGDPATNHALNAYVRNFQAQIGVDLLLLCAADGKFLAGSAAMATCPSNEGFLWVDGQPALIVRRPLLVQISGESGSERQGFVVAGIWLDAPFLTQLAAETGVQQTLVGIGGTRLVSSLDAPTWLHTITPLPAQSVTPRTTLVSEFATEFATEFTGALATVEVDGHYHFQSIAQLVNPDNRVVFYSEILLPADELFATRNRVMGILLTSTVLVALLGATLGAWSIRRITSPLASLTGVAERISQGEFETTIPDFDGPVEVQTLAAALQRSQASVVQALSDRAAARDRLDNLVHSLVEGVIIINSGGRITFWNQGAALITGWPPEQARGKLLDHVLPPLESHEPTLLSALPLAGQRRRLTVLTSGGKSTALEVTSVRGPRPGADVGFNEERALVLRDVTEEEAMHHLRGYFLANISHEFRTPLSTLNASIELLMDESHDMSGAEMRALLKPIHLSLLELQTLIDNLLEGSTIEAGQFRLQRRSMTLNEAITGALTLVQPMLERRGQTISVTEPARLEKIWADRVRLTQVLVNLLANASKYTPIGEAIDITIEVTGNGTGNGPENGPENRVSNGAGGEASAEKHNEDALYRVMVADRGPGIPAAERVNLFRRFVRLDSTQTDPVSSRNQDVYGTGIGLHVVKTTIEAHGGRVGIEDRPGGGAVFWFEIPRGEERVEV
jgi:PAS domain S-box-containing protein